MAINRRQFIGYSSAAFAAPFILQHNRVQAGTFQLDATLSNRLPDNSRIDNDSAAMIFPQSVASGDPTETGAIIWTRINEEHYQVNEPVIFRVYSDPKAEIEILEGQVEPEFISSNHDYTVKVDLDGQLEPGYSYYYRFFYRGMGSRIGRLKTLPEAQVEKVKFGVLTCQDYTNGYYGALYYLSQDTEIDYVLHLGDFIYETAGDPRFQSLPFADRTIILPSEGLAALDCRDYRHIYKTYRSDENLRLAMENHTWILTTDDHETANDAYWDYERDTLGAPDHPFALEGNDAAALKQLKLDAQQAWLEYTPTRVAVNESATHPHEYTRIYRDFKFGKLIDLFMLDTRTYRSSHPCGEGDIGGRYLPVGCTGMNDVDQTMLGKEQKEWLFNGFDASTARWTLLGNQAYFGRLGITLLGQPLAYINVDAWDGYVNERQQILDRVRDSSVRNFVVLTGDFHTYMSSYVKYNYRHLTNAWWPNIAGVEFMTPSVTSAGFIELLSNQLNSVGKGHLINQISEDAIRLNNPHIRYFDSYQNGYSTLTVTEKECDWKGYAIPKNENSQGLPIIEVVRETKEDGWAWIK